MPAESRQPPAPIDPSISKWFLCVAPRPSTCADPLTLSRPHLAASRVTRSESHRVGQVVKRGWDRQCIKNPAGVRSTSCRGAAERIYSENHGHDLASGSFRLRCQKPAPELERLSIGENLRSRFRPAELRSPSARFDPVLSGPFPLFGPSLGRALRPPRPRPLFDFLPRLSFALRWPVFATPSEKSPTSVKRWTIPRYRHRSVRPVKNAARPLPRIIGRPPRSKTPPWRYRRRFLASSLVYPTVRRRASACFLFVLPFFAEFSCHEQCGTATPR